MKPASSKKGPLKQKSKQRKKGSFLVAGLVLCLCIALGGGAYVYKLHVQEIAFAKKEREAAQIKAQKEREKRKAEIQTLFDAYLNAFENELVDKASVYKKTRKLLKNIIRPINFTNATFAKENYVLFKEILAPSLRNQSAKMIGIFESYSNHVEKELASDENELQKIFLAQWKEMTKEQLGQYIDFFAREEKMIQAYDELITFYYTHSKRYSIDEEGNKFLFSNHEDEIKAQALRERVQELQKPLKKSK